MKIKHVTTAKRRVLRVRKKILRNRILPRLTVFRSNKHISAQIIDDAAGKTVIAVSQTELDRNVKGTKTQRAKTLGLLLAQKAKKAKITKVVFDRGKYKYHGRVKSFADGAREGGLII